MINNYDKFLLEWYENREEVISDYVIDFSDATLVVNFNKIEEAKIEGTDHFWEQVVNRFGVSKKLVFDFPTGSEYVEFMKLPYYIVDKALLKIRKNWYRFNTPQDYKLYGMNRKQTDVLKNLSIKIHIEKYYYMLVLEPLDTTSNNPNKEFRCVTFMVWDTDELKPTQVDIPELYLKSDDVFDFPNNIPRSYVLQLETNIHNNFSNLGLRIPVGKLLHQVDFKKSDTVK